MFFGAPVQCRVITAVGFDDRGEIRYQRHERCGILVRQTLQPHDERFDVGARSREQLPDQRRREFAQQFEPAAELIGRGANARRQAVSFGNAAQREIDERTFADAGTAQNARDRDFTAGCAIEQRVQRFDLFFTPVQTLRNGQLSARVATPEREALRIGVACPKFVTFLEVGANGRGALVTIFRLLREQLRDDVGKPLRQRRVHFLHRRREPRDVEVDQLERVAVRERRRPGEEFVECCAERIQIGAVIDNTIHAAGLFRRDVRQRAGQMRDGGCVGILARR